MKIASRYVVITTVAALMGILSLISALAKLLEVARPVLTVEYGTLAISALTAFSAIYFGFRQDRRAARETEIRAKELEIRLLEMEHRLSGQAKPRAPNSD